MERVPKVRDYKFVTVENRLAIAMRSVDDQTTEQNRDNVRSTVPRATTARWMPNQKSRRMIMKAILFALLALSVLGSVAVPASAAWDTKAFWENLERTQGGGGN